MPSRVDSSPTHRWEAGQRASVPHSANLVLYHGSILTTNRQTPFLPAPHCSMYIQIGALFRREVQPAQIDAGLIPWDISARRPVRHYMRIGGATHPMPRNPHLLSNRMFSPEHDAAWRPTRYIEHPAIRVYEMRADTYATSRNETGGALNGMCESPLVTQRVGHRTASPWLAQPLLSWSDAASSGIPGVNSMQVRHPAEAKPCSGSEMR